MARTLASNLAARINRYEYDHATAREHAGMMAEFVSSEESEIRVKEIYRLPDGSHCAIGYSWTNVGERVGATPIKI